MLDSNRNVVKITKSAGSGTQSPTVYPGMMPRRTHDTETLHVGSQNRPTRRPPRILKNVIISRRVSIINHPLLHHPNILMIMHTAQIILRSRLRHEKTVPPLLQHVMSLPNPFRSFHMPRTVTQTLLRINNLRLHSRMLPQRNYSINSQVKILLPHKTLRNHGETIRSEDYRKSLCNLPKRV